jgi:hypothetical protein
LAADNTLQDCDGIAEGSAIDSEIIQDYKKGNQKHLQLNPNKTSKKVTEQASFQVPFLVPLVRLFPSILQCTLVAHYFVFQNQNK